MAGAHSRIFALTYVPGLAEAGFAERFQSLILRPGLVVVKTGSRGREVDDLGFVGIDFVYLCEVPAFVVLLCLAEDEDTFLERVAFGVCFCAAPGEAFHGGVVVAGARMVHPLLRYEHPDVALF